MMRKQKGFSLIELLVVVAIILIIAAIAIPNLLRSRMAANEASAVGSLRTINTGEATYSAAYPNVGYANSLGQLGGTTAQCTGGAVPTTAAACIIDNVLASGTKSGYTISAVGSGGVSGVSANIAYLSVAIPNTPGLTGTRAFCSDQSAVIYFNTDGSNILTDAACVLLTLPQ